MSETILKLVDNCPTLQAEEPIIISASSEENNLGNRDELLCKHIESVFSDKQVYSIFNYFQTEEISALANIKPRGSENHGIDIFSKEDYKTLQNVTSKLQASLDTCLKPWNYVSRSELVIDQKDVESSVDNWHRDYGGGMRITIALNDKGTMFLGHPDENISSFSYSNYDFDIFQPAQGRLAIFRIFDETCGAIHKRPPIESSERMLLVIGTYNQEDPTKPSTNLTIIRNEDLEFVGQEPEYLEEL